MISANEIKYIKSLQQKKFRDEYGLFTVEGEKLVGEALRVAFAAMAVGFAGGALVGWLCTAGTRAAMANWGLPATFAVPVATIAEGALGAVAFALLVAIPSALAIVRRRS